MGKVVFLDSWSENRFNLKGSTLYRYFKLRRLYKKHLFFANPYNENIWDDPFERYYIGAQYKNKGVVQDYPYKNRVLCMCMTRKTHSEAAWKAYGRKADGIVKMRMRLSVLLDILRQQDEYDAYIGKVSYVPHSEMKKYTPYRNMKHYSDAVFSPEDNLSWIRLLFLKRKAYDYEEEIRIVLVSKNPIPQKDAGVKINIKNKFNALFTEAYLITNSEGKMKDNAVNKLKNLGLADTQIKTEDLFVFPKDFENKPWSVPQKT